MFAQVAASGRSAEFTQAKSKEMLAKFGALDFTSADNRRLYRKLSKIGDAALSAEKFKELAELKARMEGVYSTAKVCKTANTPASACPEDQQLSLEPDLTEIMDKSRDYDELLHVWTAWRDESGKKMRDDYVKYIGLKNEAAVANGEGFYRVHEVAKSFLT